MAAAAETIIERTIRVYCPTHKVGFDASANRTIMCSSQKHALADSFPNKDFWEYCCDCQHCWIVDLSKSAVATEECLACERAIVRRFLCGSCNVVSIESDSPGRRKAFAISSGGTPTPTCPGCLKKAPANVLEHECRDFGVSFVTTFSTCPFCDEILEAPPEFPCSVSHYLSNLRIPATSLKFDPQSNTLTEAPDADYALVPRVRGTDKLFVIPTTFKFGSKRDYYDTYYELFNCDNPSPGEVIVLRPAVVEKSDSGWLVKEAGVIEIKSDEPPPTEVLPGVIVCRNCGTAGNPQQEFCGRCGMVLKDTASAQRGTSSVTSHSGQTYAAQTQTGGPYATSFAPIDPTGAEVAFGGSTSPLDNLDPAYGSSVSSTATAAAPKSTAPKILAVVAIAFVLIAVIAIALSSSGGGTNTVEKQLDEAITRGNLLPPSAQNAHDLYTQLKSSNAGEETLKRYRERIIPLLTSQPSQLLTDLAQIGSDEPTPDQWQEAAQKLNWAVQLNPADNKAAAKAAYCEGRVAYIADKKSESALQSWSRAASLDKSWALPVNGMGLIYQGRESPRDHSTSKSFFLRAMNLAPTWPHPYENLGNNYFDEKDYANAKDYYQKALEKAPDWAKPHLHLAQIAMQLNDYSTAVTEFEAALGPNARGLKGNEPISAQKQLDVARQKLSQSTSVSNF